MEYYNLNDIRELEPSAVALGYFDGLHSGHIEVIKAVLGDIQIKSAVFTFNSLTGLPKMKKDTETGKSEHILTNNLKISLLKNMEIDYIISLDFYEIKDYSPERFVKEILKNKLNAKVVSCGDDFHFGKNGLADAEELKSLCRESDIKIKIIPQKTINGKPVSSTLIRQFIKDGDIKNANKFLGYKLMYEAEVIRGEMVARTLGTPTINQVIPDVNVLPKFGVYKSFAEVNGNRYKALTNIGLKPTFNSNSPPLMETYIIGFEGDLYGKTVKIILDDFIREEIKFNNIDELKAQINKDMRKVEI